MPLPTAEGMYVVDIALPDGLTTNYGKTLPLTREMKGSAEIITDDLRLLERLIMPLRKIFMETKIGQTSFRPYIIRCIPELCVEMP